MVSRSEEKLSAHAVAREKRQGVSRDEGRERAVGGIEQERRRAERQSLALIPKEERGHVEERERRMGLELFL